MHSVSTCGMEEEENCLDGGRVRKAQTTLKCGLATSDVGPNSRGLNFRPGTRTGTRTRPSGSQSVSTHETAEKGKGGPKAGYEARWFWIKLFPRHAFSRTNYVSACGAVGQRKAEGLQRLRMHNVSKMVFEGSSGPEP